MIRLFSLFLELSLALAFPAQIPFSPTPPGLSKPSDFSVYSHPSFAEHRIRFRSPKGLCDTVEQKSGYLDAPRGRHFYFWQFDSRNDPVNDPIVLWLNGGPGCSSFTGLLMELGPCRVQPIGQDPIRNPYSWTNNASIIFLDQPVGVGYSYSSKNDTGVWTTEAAARDIYIFLSIFFDAFKEKFGNRQTQFHIAGESYAGRYIPVFVDYIIKENLKNAPGSTHIPLSSVLIGNGFTNPKLQYTTYYSTVCTKKGGFGPFVSQAKCERMKSTVARCEELTQKCYGDVNNSAVCLGANVYCEKTQTEYYYDTGRNPYDMLKYGSYAEQDMVNYYLNRPDVKEELGVNHEVSGGVKKYIDCSDHVGNRFSVSGDQSQPSYLHVPNILENNVSVLIYAGKRDFICNWLGNEAWTLALDWSGKEGFNNQTLKPWYASKEEKIQAGEYRSFKNFAFATIDDAGHFVPYNRPIESLAMFQRWVHKRDFWTL